jgi:hypothetical protein
MPPEQARSPSRVDQIRYQVFGTALEYPALLGDAEVIPLLDVVDGDLALGLGVIGSLAAQGSDLSTAAADPPSFLGAFPESLRPHVARRLAVPELAKLEAARAVLIDNLSKLRRLQQRREQPSVKEELRKAQVVDDFAAQEEVLRRVKAAAKARHKLE